MDRIPAFFDGKIRASLFLFFISFIAFTCNFRYVSSGDTLPAELMPISIIGEQDLDFNEFVEDPGKLPYYYRNVNGRVVSSYPIMPGIFNVPVYLAAHVLGIDLIRNTFCLSLISSALIASFSVVLLYLCLCNVCAKKSTAFLFSCVYAFATSLFSVACRGMWQHGTSLLLMNAALVCLLGKNKRLLPFAGLFLGFAVFNRPVNILLALPLAAYVFVYYRPYALRFLLMASFPAGLLAWYSLSYWGSITSLGQVQSLTGFDGSIIKGLPGLFCSPSRGLIIYSPIFIFSFAQMARFFINGKSPAVYRYMSWGVVLTLLFYSHWGMWWGGWTFGYRLLTELTPFLIVFLSLFWEEVIAGHKIRNCFFLVFLFVSFYVHFLGAFCYPAGFNESPNNIDQHPERLWDVKDSQIVRCNNKLLKRVKQVFIK